MTTPTILTSEDVGAPTLNGQVGSLRTVLKWALPLLGWTEEFDDAANHKVAFRNNPVSGTGSYIQFTDNGPIAANNAFAVMHGYSAMTAIDTGDHRTPPEPASTDNLNNSILKAYANNQPEAVQYRIIGTDRAFYLLTDASGENNPATHTWAFHFAGDLGNHDVGDDVFALYGWTGDDTSDASTPLNFMPFMPTSEDNDNTLYIVLSKDGANSSKKGHLIAWSWACSTGYTPAFEPGSGFNLPEASPLTGQVEYVYPRVFEFESDSGLRGSQGHRYRGQMPGLYLPANRFGATWDFRDDIEKGRRVIAGFPFPDGARDAPLYIGSGINTGSSTLWYYLIDELGNWHA